MRSVDELRQLLEYLEVDLDCNLDDKARLVQLVIAQKHLLPAPKADGRLEAEETGRDEKQGRD